MTAESAPSRRAGVASAAGLEPGAARGGSEKPPAVWPRQPCGPVARFAWPGWPIACACAWWVS